MRKGLIIGAYTLVGALVIIFFGALFENMSAGPSVRWQRHYSKSLPDPYGCLILDETLGDMFPNHEVKTLTESVYEFENYYYYHSDYDTYSGDDPLNPDFEERSGYEPHSYLFIQEELNFDVYDSEALKNHVALGNVVFLASENMQGRVFRDFDASTIWTDIKEDGLVVTAKGDKKEYLVTDNVVTQYLSSSSEGEVIVATKSGKPLVRRHQYGQGYFYFCSVPALFTNVHLLSGNEGLVENLLSRFPSEDVIYPNKYRSYNNVNNGDDNKSKTNYSFLLANPPLRWAFWIVVVTIILYMVFKAKRTQRLIPIVKPLQNSTLLFVDTIGNLYLQRGTHIDIANKQIRYFLEFVRNRYYLKTNVLDQEFIEKLSEKSSIPLEQVEETFEHIRLIQEVGVVDQKGLIKLYKLIQRMKKRSK